MIGRGEGGCLMMMLRGIPVSPGVRIGRAFVLDEEHRFVVRSHIEGHQVEAEKAQLSKAIDTAVEELRTLQEQTKQEMGDDAASIFAFHMQMLSDPMVTQPMFDLIGHERVTAAYAAWNDVAERFETSPSPTIQTKVDDVRDIASRVLNVLVGGVAARMARLDDDAVVIARDLTPSQTAAIDRGKVVAFATDMGGRTSHTAIFARALGIPAVVGIGDVTRVVTEGTPIIIDGDWGVVILNPTMEQVAQYKGVMEQHELYQLSLRDLAQLESATRDGVRIDLMGNIEFPGEVEDIVKAGGAGVGLYRLAIKWGIGSRLSRRTLWRLEHIVFWVFTILGAIVLLVLASVVPPPFAFLLN